MLAALAGGDKSLYPIKNEMLAEKAENKGGFPDANVLKCSSMCGKGGWL